MKKLVKRIALQTVHHSAFDRFVSLVERTGGESSGLLRVLTYHRVDWPDAQPQLDPGLISATPAAFEEQMAYLAENCHVLSIPELLEIIRDRQMTLPPRAVLITFDDAYVDFAEHAWPVLKRYRLPVVLFVPTAYPDQPERTFWWDRLYQALYFAQGYEQIDTRVGRFSLGTAVDKKHALGQCVHHVKSLPHDEAMEWVDQICLRLGLERPLHHALSWASLRQLAAEGVVLGAHTQGHPLVNRVSLQRAEAEAVGSLRDLRREIGSALPIFAYPSGGFDDDVVAMLRQAGFELAFTTMRGVNDLSQTDPLQIRRINVGGNTNLPVLRAQLLPGMVRLNRWLTFADA